VKNLYFLIDLKKFSLEKPLLFYRFGKKLAVKNLYFLIDLEKKLAIKNLYFLMELEKF